LKKIFIESLKKLLIPLLLVILAGGIVLVEDFISESVINTSLGSVDHITLTNSSGEFKVEKFEHIKSYPIPPNYRN